MASNATPYRLTLEDKVALIQTANELGVRAESLLAAMYFETAKSLNPDRRNAWGYQGLIQFGPREQKRYGYVPGMRFAEQVRGPVKNYLIDRGLEPGSPGLTIYRTIHGGNSKADWNKRDFANGRTTYELAKEAMSYRQQALGMLYHYDPLSGKLVLPEKIEPRQGRPPELRGAPSAEQVANLTPPPRPEWTQVADLTQPERRVTPASAPLPETKRTPVPIMYRTVQRQLGPKVDVGAALEKLLRPPPGVRVTQEEMEAIRNSAFDMRVLNSGLGTPETAASIDQFEEPLSADAVDELTRTDGSAPVRRRFTPGTDVLSGPDRTGIRLPVQRPSTVRDVFAGTDRTGRARRTFGPVPATDVLSGADRTGRKVGTNVLSGSDRTGIRLPPPRPSTVVDVFSEGQTGEAKRSFGPTKGTDVFAGTDRTGAPVGLPIRGGGGNDFKGTVDRLEDEISGGAGGNFSGAVDRMEPPITGGGGNNFSGTIDRMEPPITGGSGKVFSGIIDNLKLNVDPPTPPSRPSTAVDVFSSGQTGEAKRSFGPPAATDVIGSAPRATMKVGSNVLMGDKTGVDQRVRFEIKGNTSAAYGPEAPLPGAETVKGPAIQTPQPGATSGIDTTTRTQARPGAYPKEDTPRPSVERAPVVSPQSQMVMGIGVPERTLSPPPAAPAPEPVSPIMTVPEEPVPEDVPDAPVAPVAPTPEPVVPVDPGSTPPVVPAVPPVPAPPPAPAPAPAPVPATLPVWTPPAAAPPPVTMPTRRLTPQGFTPTGQVVQGSPAIANSRSGGPMYTYQTGQDSQGNGIVSWTRSDGSTITTYQDPSKGGGAIHTGLPVKTSSTSWSLQPAGATIW